MRLGTGVYGHRQRVCTESWLWEKNPLPHWGIEPVCQQLAGPMLCQLSHISNLYTMPVLTNSNSPQKTVATPKTTTTKMQATTTAGKKRNEDWIEAASPSRPISPGAHSVSAETIAAAARWPCRDLSRCARAPRSHESRSSAAGPPWWRWWAGCSGPAVVPPASPAWSAASASSSPAPWPE